MSHQVIELSSLTKSFGSHRGIIDVDLTIDRGEIYGFLGPNGAGKSTTIRCLLGMMHPTSGSARVLGQPPGSPAALARTGYLAGELKLPDALTGADLLRRFARIRHLTDFSYRDELVKRFEAELHRPLRTLSKGNKQKIGIVAAFMHRPDLLVLDEPTSGLDPLLQGEFLSLLRETAADGRTVFLSSHDLDEVQRVVETVAIIKDGKIVLNDTVEHLRETAPRTVELTFTRDTDTTALTTIPVVRMQLRKPREVAFTYTGPAAPILDVVATLQPETITARPADLEELFMNLYRENSHQEAAA